MKASGEENAINDIAWCPDNSTIFAAVTADAKLQIWDINASSIDPLVTVDTTLDDVLGNNSKIDLYSNERGRERGVGHQHGIGGGNSNNSINPDGNIDNRGDITNGNTPPLTPGMTSVGINVGMGGGGGGGNGQRRQTNAAQSRANATGVNPQGQGQGQGLPNTVINAPVAQLLKNLSQSVPKRSLTCLQFGEK